MEQINDMDWPDFEQPSNNVMLNIIHLKSKFGSSFGKLV